MEKPKINQNLTTINHTAMTRSKNDIKYIVIHYVGALGDAKDNTEFFKNTNRGASADFFVGHNGDIWQCNDYRTHYSWHCGGGRQTNYGGKFFQQCLNRNSVGVELCVKKKNTASLGDWDTDWYFTDETVRGAVDLVKWLMSDLGIDAEHVIRHYDVNGKICPNPWCDKIHPGEWEKFKAKLATASGSAGSSNAAGAPASTGTTYTQLYRVRTAWAKAGSQIGAYKSLENAKANCPAGYTVYDQSGKAVYKAPAKTTAADGSFKVNITSAVLRIRKEPSLNSKILGYTGRGTFTITKTSGDWGYLKSGAGWINIKQNCVKRV